MVLQEEYIYAKTDILFWRFCTCMGGFGGIGNWCLANCRIYSVYTFTFIAHIELCESMHLAFNSFDYILNSWSCS